MTRSARSGRRSGPGTPAGPSAREIALGVLVRVVEHGGYSNLALRAALGRSSLSARDRHLATELSYGTLRRLPALDRALRPLLVRPWERTAPRTRALLRLGAYQLLYTRIPPHAAVGETVALAASRERGFANAVLRRLAAAPPAPPSGSSDDDVAVRTGLAPWAVRELRRLAGDRVEEAAAALGERGPLTLRTNTCRASVAQLEVRLSAAGHAPRRGALHPDSLLLDAGTPSELPGFAEGWFAVQDQASSFVVRALEPRPGDRALDACAGPGGKAAYLACLVGPSGSVVAADVSPVRVGLVRDQAQRLRVPVHLVVQDGRRPAVRGPFDRILVDAPCSGMGSARRRPELLWRARREELSHLARLQVAIVSSLADQLAPGGRLVYSVCTFPRAETDAACDAILRHRPDLEPAPIAGPDGPAPRVRLWPHLHGTDAMFVAAFRRRASPPERGARLG
ncbi:MAG: 16S rRNA (cytosine(967)-C(5))-methyltransferase RsmB [Candidatus Velamenicoccus archaeovorus]